jgi:hypothetical protein
MGLSEEIGRLFGGLLPKRITAILGLKWAILTASGCLASHGIHLQTIYIFRSPRIFWFILMGHLGLALRPLILNEELVIAFELRRR